MDDSPDDKEEKDREQQRALARVTQTLRELSTVPEDEIEEKVISVVAQSVFSGPLPPPEQFKGYQEVLNDAPDRILSLAENEQKMRREGMRGTFKIEGRRINGSIIISLGVLVLAGFAIYMGEPWVAVPLGLAGLLGTLLRLIWNHINRINGN